MKKILFPLCALALALALLAGPAAPARADNTQPPANNGQAKADPSNPWTALIDKDGNLLPNVKDLGEVQVDNASWFPDTSSTFSGKVADWLARTTSGRPFEAEFHAYQAPSGQVLLMPTVQTAYFMTLNPDESGYAQASNQGHVFNQLQGNLSTEAGLMLAVLQGNQAALDLIKSQQDGRTSGNDASDTPAWLLAHPGYDKGAHPDQVADALIAGDKVETAPWWKGDVGQLIADLFNPNKVGDVNWGGTMLAYNSCQDSPIGQTGACQQPVNPPPADPGKIGHPWNDATCDPASATPGAIHFTAEKVSPAHPLVVGQDPQKVGVTVHWKVVIEPTIYHYWTKDQVGTEQAQDPECLKEHPDNPDACPMQDHPIYKCVQHTGAYSEGISQIVPKLSLDQSSRDWILNGQLAASYPGNYLRAPDWNFAGAPAQQGFQGNTFVWDWTAQNVQLNDPGLWHIRLFGGTSGTPVSSPRYLPTTPETGGDFRVAVFESSIIQ